MRKVGCLGVPTSEEMVLTDSRGSIPKWIEMIATTGAFGKYGPITVRKVKRHAKGVEDLKEPRDHYIPYLDYPEYEPKPRPKRKQLREQKRLEDKERERKSKPKGGDNIGNRRRDMH